MSLKGNLKLRLLDARGNRFPKVITVSLRHTKLSRSLQASSVPGKDMLIENLESTHDGQYVVQCMAEGYHTVSRFWQVVDGGEDEQSFRMPLKASIAKVKSFPGFDVLDAELARLLQNSRITDRVGQALYDGLAILPKAGLLNIHAKMRATKLPTGKAVAAAIQALLEVKQDRFLARIEATLFDDVAKAVKDDIFDEAPDILHTPPRGFERAGSVKTRDPYGNLQLTFFRKKTMAQQFLVDADLDNARGIEHVFDVIDHKISKEETHPFDIQQILLTLQGIDPGYDLIV